MKLPGWLGAITTLTVAITSAQFGWLSPEAQADSLRCGTKLVVDGDSLYDVRNRCGDPAGQSHRTELRTVREWISGPCRTNDPRSCGQVVERTVEVSVDEWIYDFGPHYFIEYLTFEQGRLVKIVSGGRGSKDTTAAP